MTGLRISELAERVGVASSTVRYYERIGLVPAPARTASGYRLYGREAEARLLFITRGKRLGLSLEEIADLLAVWDGTNCGATQERLSALLAAKRTAIAEQIRELERFADQLSDVEARLVATPIVEGCAPDLACCAPELTAAPAAVSLSERRPARSESPPEEAPAVACTLTPAEWPARLRMFEELSVHVTSWTRADTGLRLRFPARPDLEDLLRALMAREQVCCAFLAFALRRVEDEWWWDIDAADVEAAHALDEFLPLLSPARIEASMTPPPTTTRPTRTRRSAGALLIAAVCVLACVLPALGGFAFGIVLDRVFDAPAWFAVVAAVGTAVVVAGVRPRRSGGPDGC